MQEIIQIKQLPIIEEHLKQLEITIKEKIDKALSLVVADDTVKEVKQVRADLNKEYKDLEELRKKIKKQVLQPYEDFEKIYKEVTGSYSVADKTLADKISEVEKAQKDEKQQKVIEYFNEYLTSLGLSYDFITYEKANINVTLSASLKSLKEQAKLFLDNINKDLLSINEFEEKDEIFFEYSKNLDAIKSISIVKERKRVIEEQQKGKTLEEQKKKEQQEVIKKVEEAQQKNEALAPPTTQLMPPVEEEKEFQLSFKVIATKQKLRELKSFLENGGYKYE